MRLRTRIAKLETRRIQPPLLPPAVKYITDEKSGFITMAVLSGGYGFDRLQDETAEDFKVRAEIIMQQ
jgi:hypothetical protein